ncbi:hypothetical protein [Micromonospora sp. NPDC126480]|uniref:hypothetical protein n=1 Tax=Micromonospora sp. NPDC126480 TaxID=3155312 RepID=UPI00331A3CC1
MAVQILTRMQRPAACLTTMLLILVGMAACTPATEGITGVTTDRDGRLLAALAWCADRPPDSVVLRPAEASAPPTPSGEAASPTNWPPWPRQEYAVPRDATSPTTLRLTGLSPEPPLDPHTTFELYGLPENRSFVTRPVTFRLTEVASLHAGSVLIIAIVNNDEVQRTVSMEEFARLGRDEC